MRGRVGVVALVVSLFAAGIAAGAIHAGSPLSTTTDTTTTAVTTTTESTTTAPPAHETTTTVATTTAPTTTAPAPRPTGAPLGAAPLGTPRCLVLAGFALLEPGRPAMALGDTAVVPQAPSVGEGAVAYPADGSILTASRVSMSGSGCRAGARGSVSIASLSLFDGAATVHSVRLGVRNGVAGKGVAVDGLAVGGAPVSVTPGRQVVVGGWGYVVALAQPDSGQAAALEVHLTKAHAGLPAGSVLLVGFARLAPQKVAAKKKAPKVKPAQTTSKATPSAPAAHHAKKAKHATLHVRKQHAKRHVRKQHPGDAPLKVTPHLGLTGYVFPVAGPTSYGDSFGGYRGDVPGNYHHGDDLFAALGTPVVAVADGTLNRVGWEGIGGWRLWVRDHNRNEFYYAHLSGYSPLALHTKYVKKGDVIGYVGNSGDAFTTPPHLHFEVHPHQLLRLNYNGAVDPTTYIDTWRHVTRPDAPVPQHPPFPWGMVRKEARYIWRELLAARGIVTHAPKRSERPHISVPAGDKGPVRQLAGTTHREAAEHREAVEPVGRAVQTSSMGVADLLAGIVLPALLFLGALSYRLTRDRP